MSNKSKMRKTMVLLSAVCMFSIGAAGCGSGDAPASGITVEKTGQDAVFNPELMKGMNASA